MSNLRQCGMAILNYANENKGWLPYNDGGINAWDSYSVYSNIEGAYMDTSSVWHTIPRYGIYNPTPSQPFTEAITEYMGDFRAWGCPNVGAGRVNDAVNQPASPDWQLNSNYTICWEGGAHLLQCQPAPACGHARCDARCSRQDWATFATSSGVSAARTNHPVGGQAGTATSYPWEAPGYLDKANTADQTYYIKVASSKNRMQSLASTASSSTFTSNG